MLVMNMAAPWCSTLVAGKVLSGEVRSAGVSGRSRVMLAEGFVLHLMQPLAHAARLRFCIVPHAAISEDDCICDHNYDDEDDARGPGRVDGDGDGYLSGSSTCHLPLTC
jgi:hypothetical protein